MNLSQLHPYGACSSMILYDLNSLIYSEKETVHQFFLHWTTKLQTSGTLLAGTYPSHMSWVVASANPEQTHAIAFLQKLGFKRTKRAWANQKNQTNVLLLIAPAAVVNAKLKKLVDATELAKDNADFTQRYAILVSAPPVPNEDDDYEDDDWDWDSEDGFDD